MTTVGMHYDVISGKEQEFESGFAAVLEHLKKVPGHVESRLYEQVGSRGSYLIFSRWQSKEAFQSFLQSPQFRDTVSWGKAQILRSRPTHKIYQDAGWP